MTASTATFPGCGSVDGVRTRWTVFVRRRKKFRVQHLTLLEVYVAQADPPLSISLMVFKGKYLSSESLDTLTE